MSKPSKRKQKPPPPGSFDGRRLVAESGDLQKLIDLLATQPIMDATTHARILRKAVRSCAEGGFDAFTEKLLTLMLTYDGEILLRAQIMARQMMGVADQRRYGGGALGRPCEETVKWLERVALLEDRIMEIAQVRARVRHVSEIERKSQEKRRRERQTQQRKMFLLNQMRGRQA